MSWREGHGVENVSGRSAWRVWPLSAFWLAAPAALTSRPSCAARLGGSVGYGPSCGRCSLHGRRPKFLSSALTATPTS